MEKFCVIPTCDNFLRNTIEPSRTDETLKCLAEVGKESWFTGHRCSSAHWTVQADGAWGLYRVGNVIPTWAIETWVALSNRGIQAWEEETDTMNVQLHQKQVTLEVVQFWKFHTWQQSLLSSFANNVLLWFMYLSIYF